MREVQRNILHCIGNTSLLALRNIVPGNGSRILLKLESENPTGSMKDRMALAMIEAAEADGRLAAGGSVVEYTGGSTGVSLSLVCAVKGYPLHIVTSDAFAREKLDHMKILGARLQIVPSESGRMTGETDPGHDRSRPHHRGGNRRLLDRSDEQYGPDRRLSQNGGGNLESDGRTGSTASSRAWVPRRPFGESGKPCAATMNRSKSLPWSPPNPRFCRAAGQALIRLMGSERVLSCRSGRTDIADQIEQVSTEEAVAMAIRLAREEGLFAGTSTGANVIAALRLAEQLGPGATIVTVMCDTGMKYLSKR